MLQISEHVLQSDFWKETKTVLGNETHEFIGGWFQTTQIPFLKLHVGYAPRISLKAVNINDLVETAKKAKCVYVRIDPNDYKDEVQSLKFKNIKKSKPIHLQKNILIDLTKTEEEMLNAIDRKNRYNIRYGIKNGLVTEFSNTEESFEIFQNLHREVVERQKFAGRNMHYLKTVWDISKDFEQNQSTPYSVIAITKKDTVPIVASFLFIYKGVLYYTYTGSSDEYRKLNPSTVHVWNILKWGHEQGFNLFDFWGVEDDTSTGFSAFKKRFGGELVEYADTIDVVIEPMKYKLLRIAEQIRK